MPLDKLYVVQYCSGAYLHKERCEEGEGWEFGELAKARVFTTELGAKAMADLIAGSAVTLREALEDEERAELSLRSQLWDKAFQIAELQDVVTHRDKEIEEWDSRFQDLDEKYCDKVCELEELQEGNPRRVVVQSRYDAVERDLGKAQAEARALRDKLRRAEELIEAVKDQSDFFESRVHSLELALNEAEEQDGSLAAFENGVEQGTASNSELIDQLAQDVVKTKRELGAVRRQLQLSVALVEELEWDNEELKNQVHYARVRADKAEGSIVRERSEHAATKAAVRYWKSERNALLEGWS